MVKNKKVIIFDMDGTLIDSIGIWNKIDIELIKKVGTKELDDIDIGKQRDIKLKEFSKCEDIYLEYCGFLKEKYESNLSKEEIKKIRYEIAERLTKEEVHYKNNVEKVLKYLKQKGLTLIIASTTNGYTMQTYRNENQNIISRARIDDYFTAIYTKDSVTDLKPNPEVHKKILKDFSVKPEECLIIEDSLIGVEAAINAGIEVAVIYDKYSDGNREELNKLSNYYFSNYDELLECIKLELK